MKTLMGPIVAPTAQETGVAFNLKEKLSRAAALKAAHFKR